LTLDTVSKKILIAPLDWGLGHATRCIPIINEFLSRGWEVQIASNGDALTLLKREFPGCKFYELADYKARYPVQLPFMVKILVQMPKFLRAIRKEHQQIDRIVREQEIDLLISDNRYGCWSAQIPSVLITHQVNVPMSAQWKWIRGIINYRNHRQIRKFRECWVPDFPNGITGNMTQPGVPKMKYIGMLSRFKKHHVSMKREILFLISGPEQQRSIFEEKINEQIRKTGYQSYLIVKGKPHATDECDSNEVNHLTSVELNDAIESSQVIISRPGYTTVMDLCKLGKKAIFIPTPGQAEQEYLALQLAKDSVALYQQQKDFDLVLALSKSKEYRGFDGYPQSSNLLADAIDSLLTLHFSS
jgi:uncharacterized protein (TIGR00661 family)